MCKGLEFRISKDLLGGRVGRERTSHSNGEVILLHRPTVFVGEVVEESQGRSVSDPFFVVLSCFLEVVSVHCLVNSESEMIRFSSLTAA